MAKRPRQRGIKNKPATMKEFVAAVGGILKAEGFQGLRVNNIARYCGRNRSLIDRYFSGLAGLQRAYVMEQDYWTPFFKRFVLTDADGIAEIRVLFTALMQENFRFFYDSTEMQNIILWQISEANPLMTEISNGREIQGEKLFSITDPGFKNTNVNFRAVIGLLLGGIYYMVLHARTNKSTVCGIDLGNEEDRVALLHTIDQVIGWACAFANTNEKSTQIKPIMNDQFELLDTIVAQLLGRTEAPGTADLLLKNEVTQLKRAIPNHVLTLSNETQIRSYLKMVMIRLAEITEDLYDPERVQNPDASLIVDVLKTVIRHYFEALPDELILPKLFCITEAVGFNLKWQKIKSNLEAMNMDPFLIDVVYFPFSRLTLPDIELSWYDYKYLKVYASILEAETGELTGEQDLYDLLIGLGYNQTRFTAYFTTGLKKEMKGLDDHGKRQLLEQAHTAIGQSASRTLLSFSPSRVSVTDELQKWIAIEIKKGEGLALSGASTEIFDNSLNTVLSTSELACWQKLQFDAGIYLEKNVDVFTGKVSYNFKTKRGMRPSGKSVKAKLYGKDIETYRVLGPFVNKIKEDIDRFLR